MFKLDLVTPEQKLVLGQELEEISVPGFRGELNILPGHAPLMTTLHPGLLTYKLKSGQKETLAISWGYCQVSELGVSVLAEGVVFREAVDVPKAQEILKAQEQRMLTESLADAEWESVQREIGLRRAEVELHGRTP